jgi:5-methylcytosine-specific restriction endonuclease McrA
MPIPSAETQLQFLGKLQRLFAEGDFTATYKFALLIALSDLAIELGSDNSGELMITTRQLGQRFIGLYWKHCLPYGNGRGNDTAVLIQNHGAQAAVISAIAAFREKTGIASFQRACGHPEFKTLLGAVAQTVSAQPLNYLQNFGGSNDEFLYNRAGPGKIRLHPGVAYCLRRFYPLIQQLARSHWIGHIKANRQNRRILGEADDLESFLFSPSRQSLEAMAQGLRKLGGARCFYCGDLLPSADVDHFIPFALYPRDLAHNFVLAHAACNRSKSDTLAARSHLERWLERLEQHRDTLSEIGFDAGFVTDDKAAKQVCQWAYANANAAQAKAWVSAHSYAPIDSSYLGYFHSAPMPRGP